MDGWSTVFTLAAVGGVLLTFLGAWWVVRVMRARRPRPKLDEHDSRQSDSPR